MNEIHSDNVVSAVRVRVKRPRRDQMKMGDGGFRPAYNVQFATDGDARMIVSVDVTNNGSDGGQMAPMHEDVREKYDTTPQNYNRGWRLLDDRRHQCRRRTRQPRGHSDDSRGP